MENGISLCIQYYYPFDGGLRSSLYRLADYHEGVFSLVDPWKLTDYAEGFNPRFIRVRPEEEVPPYIPVIRQWNAVPKKNDYDKNSTESFALNGIQFYEILFIHDLIGKDASTIAKILKGGIRIPDYVGDEFLLVISKGSDYYTTIACRKSYFRKSGDHYRFEGKIEDPIHARHKLEQYVIRKEDVLNTESFNYLYMEDNSPALIRFFYRFEELPELDGYLYLYSLTEYIPVFVNRFSKSRLKKLEITRNEQKKMLDLLRDALSYSEDLENFFGKGGYEGETLVSALKESEDTVIKYLLNEDDLDIVLEDILSSNETLSGRYINIAKQKWLGQKDEERKKVEKDLSDLQIRKDIFQHEIEEKSSLLQETIEKKIELQQQLSELTLQKQAIVESINSILADFQVNVSRQLVQNTFTRQIGGYTPEAVYLPKPAGKKGFMAQYPEGNSDKEINAVEDVRKAYKYVERNLKRAGVSGEFGQIIARIAYFTDSPLRTIIVSGFYARRIANAISCAVDGCNALKISIHSGEIEYEELYSQIVSYEGKIILIENLLDYYNELALLSLNKDFTDKYFVIGVESEKCFSMLSGNIWNYSFLVNSDIACSEGGKEDFALVNSRNLTGTIEVGTYGDLGAEWAEKLSVFPIPSPANLRLNRLIGYFLNNEPLINVKGFMDSIIAKFSILYSSELDEQTLDNVHASVSQSIKDYYGW